MGYFPNGTSGMDYEEQYCSRCIHYPDCAVLSAHMARNYEECNNKASILHMLIPLTEDGLFNEKCLMFHTGETDRADDSDIPLKGEIMKFNDTSDYKS